MTLDLSMAQEAVARALGFRDWHALSLSELPLSVMDSALEPATLEARLQIQASRIGDYLGLSAPVARTVVEEIRPSGSPTASRQPGFDDLVTQGWMDQATSRFLQATIACRCNIIVCGMDSSSNTRLLQAILDTMNHDLAIAVVQDEAGLVFEGRTWTIGELAEREPAFSKPGAKAGCITAHQRTFGDIVVHDGQDGGTWSKVVHAMFNGLDGSCLAVASRSPEQALDAIRQSIAAEGWGTASQQAALATAPDLMVHVGAGFRHPVSLWAIRCQIGAKPEQLLPLCNSPGKLPECIERKASCYGLVRELDECLGGVVTCAGARSTESFPR